MFAVISAMPLEMETLRDVMQDCEKVEDTPFDMVIGTLNGKKLITAICGPGKVNSALCTQELILRHKPEGIINTGVAGALASDLTVGNLIIGTYAVQHDMDTSPLGDPVGYVSGVGMVRFPCDEKLVSVCEAALAKLPELHGRRGVIASGDQFICSSEEKNRIVSQFAADCCEMEGGAIAHACILYGMPCVFMRAMSDQADGEATMSYPTFARMAADNTVKLLTEVMKAL